MIYRPELGINPVLTQYASQNLGIAVLLMQQADATVLLWRYTHLQGVSDIEKATQAITLTSINGKLNKKNKVIPKKYYFQSQKIENKRVAIQFGECTQSIHLLGSGNYCWLMWYLKPHTIHTNKRRRTLDKYHVTYIKGPQII